jgi:hypothetical protein
MYGVKRKGKERKGRSDGERGGSGEKEEEEEGGRVCVCVIYRRM